MLLRLQTRLSSQRGVTLLELMIVLVIVAVLAAIAGPSFQDTIKRNRKLYTLEDTLALLSYARTEAVTSSLAVTVCPSADQVSCAGGTDWSVGVMAFIDNGADPGGGGVANDQILNGQELPLRIISNVRNGVEVIGPNFFAFDGDGGLPAATTIQICDDDGPTAASAVVLNVSGQLRTGIDSNNDDIVDGHCAPATSVTCAAYVCP
ncbi:GspH/FimT family pseudopilin [Halioglobus pacificus]|uniref:Type II secretion system protein H n=1 Tax=Parahalioglobus pacificus TaxID=930806 RepID=A0A919CLR6_9GAMM|nr:GspH/FimT family pseudopilin [Halioglobus pacificus]GHD37811.1 prepilin-type N-terminal cleavage/methylation domain-containing protein [Halioglobus pacificus]